MSNAHLKDCIRRRLNFSLVDAPIVSTGRSFSSNTPAYFIVKACPKHDGSLILCAMGRSGMSKGDNTPVQKLHCLRWALKGQLWLKAGTKNTFRIAAISSNDPIKLIEAGTG